MVLLAGAGAVLLVELCERVAHAEDLLGVDGDVGCLARRAARGFCIVVVREGEGLRGEY